MKKKNKAGTFFTPVVAVTGIFLAVIVFVSLFASVIAPYDPLATDVNAIYMHPPFLRDTFSELTDLAEIFFQGSYAVQELPF